MIGIVDYGMGNVRSLTNAFEYLGEDVVVTDDPQVMDDADRIVLPGVGAFGDAMQTMLHRDLIDPLNRQVHEYRKPLLGICLGMQLVATESVEHGYNRGLGWVDARIERLTPAVPLKVPHVGWNSLVFPEQDWLFEEFGKMRLISISSTAFIWCVRTHRIVWPQQITVVMSLQLSARTT